jgi:hypothetical protein
MPAFTRFFLISSTHHSFFIRFLLCWGRGDLLESLVLLGLLGVKK